MKKQANDLRKDVSELLERVVTQEAHDSVLSKLESAFGTLDSKSQEVLKAYFDGYSIEELSQIHALSFEQTKDWINQTKRQLLAHLQRNISARH